MSRRLRFREPREPLDLLFQPCFSQRLLPLRQAVGVAVEAMGVDAFHQVGEVKWVAVDVAAVEQVGLLAVGIEKGAGWRPPA